MKKRVIYLMVLCLFVLSNTAFATNWVNVYREDRIGFTLYVDSDSVVKNGDTIIFWELFVKDTPDSYGSVKDLVKFEAKHPRPYIGRSLEEYKYDSNNKQVWHDGQPWDFSSYDGQIYSCKAIDAAFQYAK